MTASDLLTHLVWFNLAGSAAAVLVIALRKPTRELMGARFAYGLWLLPLAAALATLTPVRTKLRTVIVDQPPNVAPTGDWAVVATTSALPSEPLDLALVAVAIWLLGVLAVAAWLSVKQARFVEEARLGQAGPAVVGLLRPRIVTPANFHQCFSADEQALILAHERAHLARRDTLACGALAAVRCICWFNPLVHVAGFLMVQDQEFACDAEVIERHPHARQAYAAAMLKAETADGPLPLGCFWPAGTRHPLMERIAMLKLTSPSRAQRLLGGAGLALACAGLAAVAWAARPAEVRVEYAEAPVAAPAPEQSLAAAVMLRPDARALQRPSELQPGESGPAPTPSDLPANLCLTNACGDAPTFKVPGADARGNVNIGDVVARSDQPAPRGITASGNYNIRDVNKLIGLPENAQTLIACDSISSTGESVCEYSVANGPVTRVSPDLNQQLAELGVSGSLSRDTYDEANARRLASGQLPREGTWQEILGPSQAPIPAASGR